MKNCVPVRRNKFCEIKISIQKNMINNMEKKTCTVCKIEKHINNFYKKYSE